MQSQAISNFVLGLIIGAGALWSPLAQTNNRESLGGKNKEPSLCDIGDTVFFTCTTNNKKIISLCGKGKADNPSGAYYRFGRKNNIELDFPENKDESSFLQFSKSHYFRAMVNLQGVFFENKGYSYTLYYEYRGDEPGVKEIRKSGVSVKKAATGEILADIKCNSNYIVKFSEFNEKVKCEDGVFCN